MFYSQIPEHMQHCYYLWKGIGPYGKLVPVMWISIVGMTAAALFMTAAYELGFERPREAQAERARIELTVDLPKEIAAARDEALALASTEDFTSKSKDGTVVNGLIVKPSSFSAGQNYPTLLYIHGGPNGQDQHSFSFDREFFSANGYVVLAVNYRGSSGRGSAYQKAIYADWGHLEVMDLLGAVDHAITAGIADPARLVIGGWSYDTWASQSLQG